MSQALEAEQHLLAKGDNEMQHVLNELLTYGLSQHLIAETDKYYAANQLIDLLALPEYIEQDVQTVRPIHLILDELLTDAIARGICEDSIDHRDLFDTKLMNCLMPRPSDVICAFEKNYETSSRLATDEYYHLSKASNYIRMDRVNKNLNWKTETTYGALDLTVNLSKPEKDPKAIAAAKLLPASNYPKCLLCKENVGYAGTLKHPARQNHRIIPIQLNEEKWQLQYSPYVYYNEHCIILKDAHEPMKVSKLTFERLLSFVSQFKHYFVGSNADLPIVGGSILTHDHFQGGNYTFAMDTAPVILPLSFTGYETVEAGMLKWPLSVIRLRHESEQTLVALADKILGAWRQYSDASLTIKAYSGETPHHTITPIARFKDGKFELDLVLRDNQTSEAHPDGIYHPHAHLHHLKKENIGLIEVMGLAVLPGRLKEELEVIKQALLARDVDVLKASSLEKHVTWVEELLTKYDHILKTDVESIVQTEVGLKFVEILECCGVYKQDDEGYRGMKQFAAYVNLKA